MSSKRLFTPERSKLLLDLLLAVVAVVTVTGLRLLLIPVLYDRAAFLLFGLAVMISSWTGGRRVGLITTALATLVGVLLFVRPFPEPTTLPLQNETLVVLFAVEGCGISFLAGQLHVQRSRVKQEARDAIRARNELEAALSQVRTIAGPDADLCLVQENSQRRRLLGATGVIYNEALGSGLY